MENETTINLAVMKEEIAEKIAETVEKLKWHTDEETIHDVVVTAWNELKELVPAESTFSKNVRKPFREAIEKTFPSSDTEKPGYYWTDSGQGRIKRWEHLGLWFATSSKDKREAVGAEGRKKYLDSLPNFKVQLELESKSKLNLELRSEQELKPETESNPKPETESKPKIFNLNDMTLETLGLDIETQAIVSNALSHSGLGLPDFIKQACTVYAKTVMGKAKQSKDDLSTVPTKELLNVSEVVNNEVIRSKYFTHPKRAEELTRRAIEAIKNHNINAPEKDQRWCITQTAIQALTGSRPATIKSLLEQYKIDIDGHNETYKLKPYDNRKGSDRKIENEVDLAALVPDGL